MNPTLKGQCMRKNCAYHSKSVGSCDYLLIAGHRRGCSIENCDKYRKKKREIKSFRDQINRGNIGDHSGRLTP